MSKYTDSPENFNLIQVGEQTPLTKRNYGIFDMILNRLGLPDHLHEFVRGIMRAGNWHKVEWDEISLMRVARNLTSDEVSQLRVFNRIKKNSPKFFDWQEKQSVVIIERIILREHGSWHKTKAKYRFVLWPLVDKLWSLPMGMTEAAIQRVVNLELKDYPIIEKPKRRGRKRKPESMADAAGNLLLGLGEETGSPEAAGLYLSESSPVITQGEYISRILEITLRNIRLKSGLL